MTYYHLLTGVVADELGDIADDVVGHRGSSRLFMRQLSQNEGSDWWDDQSTATVESREEQLGMALAAAVSWLVEQQGDNPEAWRWGDLHQATFRSNPLGQSGISLIENLVNRGPFPADGGEDIVNAMGWDWDNPAVVDWHPSMRMIVDFANFDQSLAILPTGQSGHPGHKYYDDMIDPYLNGQYHPWPYSADSVTNATVDLLTLNPAP